MEALGEFVLPDGRSKTSEAHAAQQNFRKPHNRPIRTLSRCWPDLVALSISGLPVPHHQEARESGAASHALTSPPLTLPKTTFPLLHHRHHALTAPLTNPEMAAAIAARRMGHSPTPRTSHRRLTTRSHTATRGVCDGRQQEIRQKPPDRNGRRPQSRV